MAHYQIEKRVSHCFLFYLSSFKQSHDICGCAFRPHKPFAFLYCVFLMRFSHFLLQILITFFCCCKLHGFICKTYLFSRENDSFICKLFAWIRHHFSFFLEISQLYFFKYYGYFPVTKSRTTNVQIRLLLIKFIKYGIIQFLLFEYLEESSNFSYIYQTFIIDN